MGEGTGAISPQVSSDEKLQQEDGKKDLLPRVKRLLAGSLCLQRL